jgi:F-type H+-transporting ATPase subunit b
MQELIHQLGIDWKLLFSQTINFGIVLIILRIFVYKPLLKILTERRKKIEEGLVKAKEANERLLKIENIKLEKIKEAEENAMLLIQEGKEKAKQIEVEILEKAREKQEEILRQADLIIADKAKKAEQEVYNKAKELIYKVIEKTIELDSSQIDEALINKSLESLKNEAQL